MKQTNKNTLPSARPRLASQFCKRLLAVFASSFLAATALCASGTWSANGITWKFDYAGTEATITGAEGYSQRLVIPQQVEFGGTAYDVTAIDDYAFEAGVDQNVSSVAAIAIPPSVRTIGNYAFSGCESLVNLELAYDALSGDGVEEIKDGAFQNASKLEGVTFPETVKFLGDYAFAGCKVLETVTFKGNAGIITMDPLAAFAATPFLMNVNENDNFEDAIEIEGSRGRTTACNIIATDETGEPLGYQSMWWAWTAPAGATKAAFYTYGSSFPTALGVYTGTAVDALTEIAWGYSRLSDNTSFAVFDVTPGQTYYIYVTGSGFADCGTINLGWLAAGGFSLVVHDNALLGFIGDCPASVAIPDGVSTIEQSAFDHDEDTSVDNLTSVVIPGSVTRIEWYAFYECANLASVTFEDPEVSVTMSVKDVFRGTPYLASLESNDNWANAIEITGASGAAMSWNANATLESGEPLNGQDLTMWWKWKAPAGVTKAKFHTYGSEFDTVLGVYTGTAVDALTEVVPYNDDYHWTGEKNGNSLVSFDVTPGKTYYICVAGYDSAETGVVRLGWKATAGFSFLTWGETLLESFGPCPESVTIPDTISEIVRSAFDHDYFPSVDNLKSVAIPAGVTAIGDWAFYECPNLSSVTFEGEVLEIDMNPLRVFSGTPFLDTVNANDDFANAIELTGKKGSVEAWNAFATTEAGEPADTECHSLWWKWTAPAGVAKAVFHTSGSQFDTVLGVYEGTAVDALTDVAINDDRGGISFVSFNVTPGNTYYICVAGYDEDEGGSVKLTWEAATGFSLVVVDGLLVGFLGDCPESVTIPNTVTEIGESAFDAYYDPSAANLKKVDIPGSVTAIRSSAFYDCNQLTSVTFGEGLETIEGYAFEGCTGLKGQTIFLPTTVTIVDGDAFGDVDGPLTLMLPRSLNGMLTSGKFGTTDLAVGYYVKATLDPNSGTLAAKDRVRLLTGDTFGDLAPLPTRTGYTFKGWKLGTTAITATTALPDVAALTLTAQWEIIKEKVTFDLGGGTGAEAVTVNYGTKVGDIPQPTRDNYEFIGWAKVPTGGTVLPANTPVTANLKLYAQWKAIYYLYADAAGEVPQTAASKYEGFLYTEKGKAVGSIEVKLSKPKKNRKLAGTPLTTKPTVTIILPGEGKAVIKGTDVLAGSIVIEGTIGTRELKLKIGANGLEGTFGEFGIEGARSLFASKDKSEVAAANAVLDKWLGAVCLVTDTGDFSVALSAKGKAKLSGTINGKKLSGVKGQLLVGEEWCCLPLIWSKGGTSGSYTLWLKNDGSAASVAESETALVGKPGTLGDGAQFAIDDIPALVGIVPGMFTDQLPTNVAVKAVGTKWMLPKAGKVAYKRGTTEIDATKLGENPSALKLTYMAKDGSFKGSFKVYADNAGRLKATTVNVTGVVINGVGYGTAVVKGASGSVPVKVK